MQGQNDTPILQKDESEQQNNDLLVQQNDFEPPQHNDYHNKIKAPYFSNYRRPKYSLNAYEQKQNTLPALNISTKIKANLLPSQYNNPEQTSKLFSNKNIQYLYINFCKQMYNGGGAKRTFDDISESSEKMHLNKWLIFCKEFQLTKKLSPKQATEIFKEATNFYSYMTYRTFIRGLELVKKKGKIEEKELVKDILHANNHYEARDKLSNLKIHFTGPQKNCFDEMMYTEEEKRSVRPRNEYKKRFVLPLQFEESRLKREIEERKETQKQRLKIFSQNRSEVKHKPYMSEYKREGDEPKSLNTYKQIFKPKTEEIKKNQSQLSTYKNDPSEKTSIAETRTEKKLSAEVPEKKYIPKQIKGPKREWIKYGNKKQEKNKGIIKEEKEEEKPLKIKEWKIDSDAESDQILKQHYEHEKQSRKFSIMNRKFKSKKTEVEDDKETDLMITQYR